MFERNGASRRCRTGLQSRPDLKMSERVWRPVLQSTNSNRWLALIPLMCFGCFSVARRANGECSAFLSDADESVSHSLAGWSEFRTHGRIALQHVRSQPGPRLRRWRHSRSCHANGTWQGWQRTRVDSNQTQVHRCARSLAWRSGFSNNWTNGAKHHWPDRDYAADVVIVEDPKNDTQETAQAVTVPSTICGCVSRAI